MNQALGHGAPQTSGQPAGPAGDVEERAAERATAAEALREANESLDITFQSIGEGVISTDLAGKIARMNPVAEALTGWTAVEATGRPVAEVFRIFHPQTRQPSADPVARVLVAGQKVGLTNHTALLARDGQEHQIAETAAPIRDTAGQTRGVVLVFRDMTREYADADALRASEARYRRLFESARDGILILEAETGMVVDVNPFLIKLLGYSHEAFLGKNVWELGFFKDIAANQAYLAALQQSGYVRYDDMPLETVHGGRIDVEFVSNVYTVGHEKVIQCNIRDITARKRVEAVVRASLREKDALLREIHHRVKNNLQIISSLLRLQSNQISHPAAQAVLLDMQHRVRSMALIHEHLYQAPDLAAVDLAAYLQQLCTQLLSALVERPGRLQLRLNLAPVRLGIEQAIPCGLMVNELLSNCFKHAFPDGRAGEVQVQLQAVADGSELRLRVVDDGVGLPVDFDLNRLTSLGLHLASDLARQIGGVLVPGSAGPGTVFEVVFTPKPDQPST